MLVGIKNSITATHLRRAVGTISYVEEEEDEEEKEERGNMFKRVMALFQLSIGVGADQAGN